MFGQIRGNASLAGARGGCEERKGGNAKKYRDVSVGDSGEGVDFELEVGVEAEKIELKGTRDVGRYGKDFTPFVFRNDSQRYRVRLLRHVLAVTLESVNPLFVAVRVSATEGSCSQRKHSVLCRRTRHSYKSKQVSIRCHFRSNFPLLTRYS